MELTKVDSACANTILDCFFNRNGYMTHMKLQKLLYFSHGVYLSKYNRTMVENHFQAWPYGPVLPALYDNLKQYKDAPITEGISFKGIKYAYNDGEILGTIKSVVKEFGHYTAWELSKITHATNGPWFKTVSNGGYKQDIGTDLIMNYFKENPIL